MKLKPDIPPWRVLLKTKFIIRFALADVDYFSQRGGFAGRNSKKCKLIFGLNRLAVILTYYCLRIVVAIDLQKILRLYYLKS